MKKQINKTLTAKKTGLSVALLCMLGYATPLYAQSADSEDVVCQQLQNDINQAEQQQQRKLQLEKIKVARNDYCLGDNSMAAAAKMTNKVLKDWSAEILNKVIATGDKARFDSAQIQKLVTYKDDIATMKSYINTTQQDWLPALLDLLVSNDNGRTTEQLATELQPIFNGLLDDIEAKTAPAVVERVDLVNFISGLDQGLNLNNPSEKALASRSGEEETAQARLMKQRGASLVSSAEKNDPNSVNTPIRFKYNSTELTERGVQEYKIMLNVLVNNTTKSIFLIGHSSPEGSAEYNCKLSKRRVLALKNHMVNEVHIPAERIKVAWAGENIPLNFGQAKDFLEGRDIIDTGEESPKDAAMRRRVEIEINGELLRQRYAGKFCDH